MHSYLEVKTCWSNSEHYNDQKTLIKTDRPWALTLSHFFSSLNSMETKIFPFDIIGIQTQNSHLCQIKNDCTKKEHVNITM